VGGTCGRHGRGERCLLVLVGRSEGKRPLGRSRHRWEITLSWSLGRKGSMG
jgi:hypothetical protein